MISKTERYEEEFFGILSDDNLYLDCIMIKPPGLTDDQLHSLKVWVPRYPLMKNSTITCARREVTWDGPKSNVAHLVFDLRGTGESDGTPGDKRFEIDLNSVRAWADERFGPIKLEFLGRPDGRGGARMLPIRPGVIAELYVYEAVQTEESAPKPPIIYLSTFGKFDRIDDALCYTLAQAGYQVYGIDPLRYLLHGSSRSRLTFSQLAEDLEAMCNLLSIKPVLIGQPLGAGLALMWAAGYEKVRGVIAIGHAQVAFNMSHLFHNDNIHDFFVSKQLYRISPRPVVFVMVEGSQLGGSTEEIGAFYASADQPRRAERTKEINPIFLLKMLQWIENPT